MRIIKVWWLCPNTVWKYCNGENPRCIVCGLETNIRGGFGLQVEGCTEPRCKPNMVCCNNPDNECTFTY